MEAEAEVAHRVAGIEGETVLGPGKVHPAPHRAVYRRPGGAAVVADVRGGHVVAPIVNVQPLPPGKKNHAAGVVAQVNVWRDEVAVFVLEVGTGQVSGPDPAAGVGMARPAGGHAPLPGGVSFHGVAAIVGLKVLKVDVLRLIAGSSAGYRLGAQGEILGPRAVEQADGAKLGLVAIHPGANPQGVVCPRGQADAVLAAQWITPDRPAGVALDVNAGVERPAGGHVGHPAGDQVEGGRVHLDVQDGGGVGDDLDAAVHAGVVAIQLGGDSVGAAEDGSRV